MIRKQYKIFFFILIVNVGLVSFYSCQTNTNSIDKTDANGKIKSIQYIPEWVDTSKVIKEDSLISFITTAKTIKPNFDNGVPFNKLQYDKVIAYDFSGSEEPYPNVIDRNGKFVPVVLGQQYLTQKQADKILSALAKNSTYGESTAACFQPHFALVLYKNNKKISQINICLDCNYLISEVTIPAEVHKKVKIGKNEYSQTGFTKSGKKAIIDLCKELNFYYGIKGNKMAE